MKHIDKLYHFGMGFAIAFLLGFFSPNLGFAAGVIAGIVKEGRDLRFPTKHTADALDAFATGLGAALGLVVHMTAISMGIWSPL